MSGELVPQLSPVEKEILQILGYLTDKWIDLDANNLGTVTIDAFRLLTLSGLVEKKIHLVVHGNDGTTFPTTCTVTGHWMPVLKREVERVNTKSFVNGHGRWFDWFGKKKQPPPLACDHHHEFSARLTAQDGALAKEVLFNGEAYDVLCHVLRADRTPDTGRVGFMNPEKNTPAGSTSATAEATAVAISQPIIHNHIHNHISVPSESKKTNTPPGTDIATTSGRELGDEQFDYKGERDATGVTVCEQLANLYGQRS